MKFLRVPILDDMRTFRKHITVPVQANSSGRFANLRRLLESLCLRRTRTLLGLPDPINDTQMLKFSASESAMYQDFGENCRHAIDLAVSGHSMQKANHHVIRAILGMRLFCNDGPKALLGKWGPCGFPSDPEEALSYLQTTGKSICAQCECEVLALYQADDRSSGVLTICQHVLCGECRPIFEADLDAYLEDGRTQCPICGLQGSRDAFITEPSQQCASTSPQKSYPTKLLALLENVRGHNSADKW